MNKGISRASIVSEAMPEEVVSVFEWAMVTLQTPAGPLQAIDLFLQARASPSTPPQTRRYRFPPNVLHGLARGVSEASEQLSAQAGTTPVQRWLDTVQTAPATAPGPHGDRQVFLLTLNQKDLAGQPALPVRLAVEPQQLLGLYALLGETIDRHQLAPPAAPSTGTRH